MAANDALLVLAHQAKACLTAPVILIIAFLLVALTNLKVLPLAWHVRIFYGYYGHYALDRRSISPSTSGSLTLFQPTIYTTSLPLGELDHNMHKSNSTYLTDLDVARGYHIYSIFRLGTREYTRRGAREGTFNHALGGVSMSFRRPIGPFQKYDIWTRVLSWDAKWLYLVSHFVPAGTAMPAIFSHQPGSSGRAPAVNHHHSPPIVYATSVAKIVMKQGRKTIPFETFLRTCKIFGDDKEAEDVLRAKAEKSRQEGVRIAECVAGLDGAFDWFKDNEKVAFARY
ncbi:hypothetical protein EV127DRAFT_237739 [Xylaria flabelliformis]|nr:hypothetical protein EV127DRAFT_237739 [Xylaria flabelliformis]